MKTEPQPEKYGSPAALLGGWVSCVSELPPLDVPVWLWVNVSGSIIIGCRSVDDGHWFWCNCYGSQWWDDKRSRWDAGDAEMDDDYKPTHWMALPNPPNAKAQRPGD